MTSPNGPLPILATLVMAAMVVVACGPGTSSTSRSNPASPSVFPDSTPSAAPTAAPSALPAASASASAATTCAVLPQAVQLPFPFDRITDLRLSTGSTADRLIFLYGTAGYPGPATPAEASLDVAQPPYTQAGSGATIVVAGTHVLRLRFSGMSQPGDAAGFATYVGPTEVKPNALPSALFPALRHAVMYDAPEGIVGWYVGYDGSGCVTLAFDYESGVTLTIDHP
jgi:hypothetical protein